MNPYFLQGASDFLAGDTCLLPEGKSFFALISGQQWYFHGWFWAKGRRALGL